MSHHIITCHDSEQNDLYTVSGLASGIIFST